MKVILAMDSFKGCLSSGAAEAVVKDTLMEMGVRGEDIVCLPMSDGGEGFCTAVSSYLEGKWCTLPARGPLGNIIDAPYFLADHEGVYTAFIESASVCGYSLVDKTGLDPFRMTSYGLGQLIADACGRGVGRIVVGMGGTCTCEGGVGMLLGLGAKVSWGDLSTNKEGSGLCRQIESIDFSEIGLDGIEMQAWSDTRAPLCGKNGAAHVFGPQKGLPSSMVGPADEWLERLGTIYGKDVLTVPGGGAAGGIGAALSALGAEIRWGADGIIALSRLRDILRDNDYDTTYLISGEGHFDSQTLTGKLPSRVAEAGRGLCRTLCFAGRADSVEQDMFDAVIRITPDGMDDREAMETGKASENLSSAVRDFFADILHK